MKGKRALNRLIPLLYFMAVSFPHHQISELFQDFILIPLGMAAVQQYLNEISAVFVCGLVVVLLLRFRKEKKFAARAFFLGAFVMTLIWLSNAALLVNNIERIHFVQYAGLAILLRLTIRDNSLVFFTSVVAGMVDEFLQYLMNPVRTSYFDFNDIVFNVLGAAMGMILAITLFSEDRQYVDSYERAFRKAFVAFTGTAVLVSAMAFLTGRIVTLQAEAAARHVFSFVGGRLSFVISFENQTRFWELADNGKMYHVLRPWEGVVLLSLLLPMLWLSLQWLVKAKANLTDNEAACVKGQVQVQTIE